ncbi:MAG: hypothetical protein GXP55_02525, partial [Deltaproteobacteria bacterium]|nr:hypothetical protein [Deltaproteobacteria bacterium]
MTRLPLSALLLLALALPVAHAQDAAPSGDGQTAPTRYEGVTPEAGSPPAERRVRRSRNRLLTWPGFESRPNGASRFFVQLSREVQFTTRASQGRFEVLLAGTRTHLRNTRRPLETRFFNTPVIRAKVERRGRHNLALVFELRAAVTPRVYTQPGPGGYTFLFVDFPEG